MDELARNFGVDWRLLLAQVVNFGVIFFVLWRFAYRPIVRILHRRKEEIEKGLLYTEEAKEKLEKIEETKNAILNKAEKEALAAVKAGEDKAKVRQEEIVRKAEKKGGDLITNAKRTIAEEKAKMSDELRGEAEDLILTGVAKVLGRMSPSERDKVLVKEAIQELKSLKI